MKKMRNIAIIVVLVLGAYWLGSFYQWGGQRTEVTSDLIKNRLEQTAELASTNYYYTNMGSYEDYHLFMGHNIPLTGKKFIVSYDGLIKSGIDLDLSLIHI